LNKFRLSVDNASPKRLRAASQARLARPFCRPVEKLPVASLMPRLRWARPPNTIFPSEFVPNTAGRIVSLFLSLSVLLQPCSIPTSSIIANMRRVQGIGNGLPLAAVVTTPEIASVLTSRIHFNTYGGNPVVSAAGQAVLRVLDQEKRQVSSWNRASLVKVKPPGSVFRLLGVRIFTIKFGA
jgi:hypothetical protein